MLTVSIAVPLYERRESKRRYRGLQALRHDTIRVLRQANDELDSEWRQRRRDGLLAAAGADSERRWQWRWVGVQRDLFEYYYLGGNFRPRLALVHIAPPSL